MSGAKAVIVARRPGTSAGRPGARLRGVCSQVGCDDACGLLRRKRPDVVLQQGGRPPAAIAQPSHQCTLLVGSAGTVGVSTARAGSAPAAPQVRPYTPGPQDPACSKVPAGTGAGAGDYSALGRRRWQQRGQSTVPAARACPILIPVGPASVRACRSCRARTTRFLRSRPVRTSRTYRGAARVSATRSPARPAPQRARCRRTRRRPIGSRLRTTRCIGARDDTLRHPARSRHGAAPPVWPRRAAASRRKSHGRGRVEGCDRSGP